MGSKGRKNVKKPKAAKAKGKAAPETKKKQNGENSKHCTYVVIARRRRRRGNLNLWIKPEIEIASPPDCGRDGLVMTRAQSDT